MIISLRFVLDALESHPKTSNVIISPFFFNCIFVILFPPTKPQCVWNHGRKSQEEEFLDIEILETTKIKMTPEYL